jgi:hypothetical protein
MWEAVVLDTGVLSLIVNKPGKSDLVTEAQEWFWKLDDAGVAVYIPEICDYELRRELIRSQKASRTLLNSSFLQ